jgi:hypothetical protein
MSDQVNIRLIQFPFYYLHDTDSYSVYVIFVRSAVNAYCIVYPCNCGKTFPHLSRDPPPVGSLHAFASGQILNPYLPHYKTAFAFSNLFYLPAYGLPLRVGFHFHGDKQAYQVPLI